MFMVILNIAAPCQAHQHPGVPAQAYVALSRARSMEGLQVLDFASGCVKVCSSTSHACMVDAGMALMHSCRSRLAPDVGGRQALLRGAGGRREGRWLTN